MLQQEVIHLLLPTVTQVHAKPDAHFLQRTESMTPTVRSRDDDCPMPLVSIESRTVCVRRGGSISIQGRSNAEPDSDKEAERVG